MKTESIMSNKAFLDTAESLKPHLYRKTVTLPGKAESLNRGDEATYDFGKHLTGRVRLVLSGEGHHPDAPVWLRLRFAERLTELSESLEDYRGWISTSWIQEEELRIDVLPAEIRLPRRYAFRYLRIEVRGISSRFSLKIREVSCEAATSADEEAPEKLHFRDPLLDRVDEVACATLRECMQEVFEDGPKRDRRLWLGDLRLQALANYETFRNNDLVKRCLYLFAGTALADGSLPTCLFTEPEVEGDDQYMFDYSLLFAKALQDYHKETGDRKTAEELWPTVKAQFAAAEGFFGPDGLIRVPEGAEHWCFVDWNLELDKETAALGIWLYCAEAALSLAETAGDEAFRRELSEKMSARRKAAEALFDPAAGLFVSGPARQISLASQIWAVLGGLTEDPEILSRAASAGALKIVSPYLMHYELEALMKLGRKEETLGVIRSYWGGMVRNGADTFWELYDPEDPDGSPYGGTIVNSYCHAWSCTPSYFLRRHFRDR